MDILKRSGILIPTKYRNNRWYVRIKDKLERRTQSYDRSNIQFNIFYLESEKFLLIPRHFPLHKFIFEPYEIHDHSHTGEKIKIDHRIEPRDELQKNAMEKLMTSENCILQLPPGVGKTVISIYMIAERKLKSFILVHRDGLADQWRDRLLTFTDLEEDQIARLTSQTFEDDLQKPIIISTNQTFTSLLKRHRRNFLTKLNEANIGIFVADEVHTSVGAPTFSECSIHIPARYTYGLSATPYRYDGNGDIIEYHLGPIFSNDDSSGTMESNVTVILLDYEIDTPRRRMYVRWGGEFQRSRYLNLLKKSKPFREVLRGLLRRLIKDDRNLLCISERINLIDEVFNETKSSSKSRFYRNAKLDELNHKVTFATPGKCRDGIDAPWKDSVVMTSPITNIEQLTGRVVRKKEGKKTPIIIDMVDFGCDDMSKSFFPRKTFYERKGWSMQYILYHNNKLKQIDEETALAIIRREQ
jgi:superfamily II DNA or RNA helicase